MGGGSGALTIRESPTSDPTAASPPPVLQRRRELMRPSLLLTKLLRSRRRPPPRPGEEPVPASPALARAASPRPARGDPPGEARRRAAGSSVDRRRLSARITFNASNHLYEFNFSKNARKK